MQQQTREYKVIKRIEKKRADKRMKAGRNQYSPGSNLVQGKTGRADVLAAQKVGMGKTTADAAEKVVDYIDKRKDSDPGQ